MRKLAFLICNLLWFLSSIPVWLIFLRKTNNVKHTQSVILQKYASQLHVLKGMKSGGKKCELSNFSQELPLQEYKDYESKIQQIREGEIHILTIDPVLLLEPTGGTTEGSKLIPYNRSLRKEYQRAINPWIADMFIRFPRLFCGTHYWSISPNTIFNDGKESAVPIGFDDDTEYLSNLQSWISSCLMAVPSKISQVRDMKTFEYLSLLFLVKDRNLRLISIWHPSFLTILLGKLPQYWNQLIDDVRTGSIRDDLIIDDELRSLFRKHLAPDRKRAGELTSLDAGSENLPGRIWRNMQLISCWGEGSASSWITRLEKAFPGVHIQKKGIVATEGIISIPYGPEQLHVLAVNSHFFEFLDRKTGECKPAWEVEKGKTYSVVITTGGGLCRYRLHDLVEITGFFNQAPVLHFLGRESLVSDIAGEKIHQTHVDNVIEKIKKEFSIDFEFALINPKINANTKGGVGYYSLYVHAPLNKAVEWDKVEKFAEEQLCRNYHYRHARNLKQLKHISLVRLKENPDEAIRTFFAGKGRQLGDIKINGLIVDLDLYKVLAEIPSFE